ncbi:hypothetical protein FB45DRAFT_872076 [Roridomyces roridus]|uniref:Uncharacterized protein n=1 Tax=Roridomyces roridus TaxID=1738132 RepID=A0AAD7FE74_9AGAR|nr:hypothetical protein FB45DRAFT_872076 [Roridomyces roridus]
MSRKLDRIGRFWCYSTRLNLDYLPDLSNFWFVARFLSQLLKTLKVAGRSQVFARILTIMSGVFLFDLIAATTSTQVNALISFANLWENTFYGVLYGYAPEVFPTPRRGTGDALAAATNRVTSLFALSESFKYH